MVLRQNGRMEVQLKGLGFRVYTLNPKPKLKARSAKWKCMSMSTGWKNICLKLEAADIDTPTLKGAMVLLLCMPMTSF